MLRSERSRVLLIDDNEDVVTALRRFLSLECDVVGAMTEGEGGVDETLRLQPDAVVVDCNLGGISGLEICRRLRQTMPRLVVILLTAGPVSALEEGGRAAGASAVITKHNAHDIVPAIHRALQTRADGGQADS
jgi:DNA-binding response OmpR family regulator